jgi:DNA-directed RNA polymerase subunit RPC12/RpoP
MPASPLKCPQCGGALDLQPFGHPASCPYCGSQHVVPESATRQPTPEEIQAKLTEARLHAENMMNVIMPNRRKVTLAVMVFIFIVVALVLGGILMAIMTGLRH